MGAGASLRLEGLRVFREAASARRVVVDGVTLRAAPGERLFLLGPNGAGKTSILLALVGAVPFEGRIAIGELEVSPRTIQDVRRAVGFVFADPSDQFFMSEVSAEVAYGPRTRGLDPVTVTARVEGALAAVRLSGFAGRSPDELSLGEQRRLAIATALAIEPDVFLLDEPTASLDPRARHAVLEAVARVPATVVVATHDLDAAYALDGRAVLIRDGRVVGDGRAREILKDAALLDAAGLVPPIAAQAVER